jgi:hypothetical protein
MAKFHPIKALRRAIGDLYDKAAGHARRFSGQTDEMLNDIPIDFSAPSIPYYQRLAERLSFIRVVLYMILVAFVAVTVVSNHRLITYENLYYLAKDIGAATLTAQSTADQISYPISSADSDFALFRGGVVIAGGEVVTAMSGSGRQTLSVNVAYASPCVVASDKYCITFGRGETSFAVYNSFVQVYKEITDFPVYAAAAGDNGNFAIVTRSRDYTSEVVLYDGNMDKLAACHLNGYVTGIAMNREGNRVGIVSAESKNGLWETKITIIRVEKRITQSAATVSGTLGSTCGFIAEDRFATVMEDRIMIWGSDATVKGETILEAPPALAALGEGRVAILSRQTDELGAYTLTVYDRSARVTSAIELGADHPISKAGTPDSLAFGDTALFLRVGESLFRLAGNGNRYTQAAVSRDTLAILPVSADEVLVCTPAYATRLYGADFGE